MRVLVCVSTCGIQAGRVLGRHENADHLGCIRCSSSHAYFSSIASCSNSPVYYQSYEISESELCIFDTTPTSPSRETTPMEGKTA